VKWVLLHRDDIPKIQTLFLLLSILFVSHCVFLLTLKAQVACKYNYSFCFHCSEEDVFLQRSRAPKVEKNCDIEMLSFDAVKNETG